MEEAGWNVLCSLPSPFPLSELPPLPLSDSSKISQGPLPPGGARSAHTGITCQWRDRPGLVWFPLMQVALANQQSLHGWWSGSPGDVFGREEQPGILPLPQGTHVPSPSLSWVSPAWCGGHPGHHSSYPTASLCPPHVETCNPCGSFWHPVRATEKWNGRGEPISSRYPSPSKFR